MTKQQKETWAQRIAAFVYATAVLETEDCAYRIFGNEVDNHFGDVLPKDWMEDKAFLEAIKDDLFEYPGITGGSKDAKFVDDGHVEIYWEDTDDVYDALEENRQLIGALDLTLEQKGFDKESVHHFANGYGELYDFKTISDARYAESLFKGQGATLKPRILQGFYSLTDKQVLVSTPEQSPSKELVFDLDLFTDYTATANEDEDEDDEDDDETEAEADDNRN